MGMIGAGSGRRVINGDDAVQWPSERVHIVEARGDALAAIEMHYEMGEFFPIWVRANRQWTHEEAQVLRSRKQPFAINRVKPKVRYLCR